MPWTVIEYIDDDGEETTHIVPFVAVENSFETQAEAQAFAEEREAAGDSVADAEGIIIGIHKGHTLSRSCVCGAKAMESDPGCYIHNAAN